MSQRKLWIIFAAVIVVSFAILGGFGREIHRQAPPVPERVVTETGEVLFTGDDIRDGQNVWQSTAGQELGSVWGHGAYLAPDWTADWLHREAEDLLARRSMAVHGVAPSELLPGPHAALVTELQQELRGNTYDPTTGDLVVSRERGEAIQKTADYYIALFGDDPALAATRDAYAMRDATVVGDQRRAQLAAFFFWTAWASVAERPGGTTSYTNNWPADDLVGNRPPASLILWTGFSVVLLLAGIALLSWYYAASRHDDDTPDNQPVGREASPHAGRRPSTGGCHGREDRFPERDPLLGLEATPSMRATLPYFWVVCALIVVQVMLGVIAAHYSVEGGGFYGLDLDGILPYSITRTWHVQLAIFWIATSWLATGLFIGPAVSGHEPPHQRLGVLVLFVALLIVVVGSMTGEWLGVMQHLGLVENFWWGHQGYEYVDLGRVWQILLFVGLLLWLTLMVRALLPALRREDENHGLLSMLVISSAAIALFYGAGLMWGRQTNLAVAEYWRWWVVHLWVEGFFEVFATVVIAFLFVRLGLLRVKLATTAALFSTNVFLAGGIVGTFHHLYFTGTPTAVLALGASFSALEVVPLVLIGFEAYHNITLSRATPWLSAYRWPIFCFIAVAFWNLLGAGIFGFLINPPIALYYMQGLNTTPVHGHTALFGVYGMLGIGLMLFVLKGLAARAVWKEGVIRFAFWSINIGLLLMVALSTLPIGLAQTVASVEHGLWYARSTEFLAQDYLQVLRWLRVVGDTIFGVGVLALGWFVIGLKTGWSLERDASDLPA
jgi:nitric oxide reductase subunit B